MKRALLYHLTYSIDLVTRRHVHDILDRNHNFLAHATCPEINVVSVFLHRRDQNLIRTEINSCGERCCESVEDYAARLLHKQYEILLQKYELRCE